MTSSSPLDLYRSWRGRAQRTLIAESWLLRPLLTEERRQLRRFSSGGRAGLLRSPESRELQKFGLDPIFLLLIERDRLRENQIAADPEETLGAGLPPDWSDRRWQTLGLLRRRQLFSGEVAEDLWKRGLQIWKEPVPMATPRTGLQPERRAAADGTPPLLFLRLPVPEAPSWLAEVALEPTAEGDLFHLRVDLEGSGVAPLVELGLHWAGQGLWVPLPTRAYLRIPNASALTLSLRGLV